eukprot:981095_1
MGGICSPCNGTQTIRTSQIYRNRRSRSSSAFDDHTLKYWLCGHSLFNPHLYDHLKAKNIHSDQRLQLLSPREFGTIVKNVRNASDGHDVIQNILTDFEILWKDAYSRRPHNPTPETDAHIVDGFIRSMDNVMYYNIPNDINQICFSYYHSRYGYTKECVKWEKKLHDIAYTSKRTSASKLVKIWNKIDREEKGQLDYEKSVPKLMYIMIALHIRSNKRGADIPRYKNIKPLAASISDDIRMSMTNKVFMTKDHFSSNIGNYLDHVAQKRTKAESIVVCNLRRHIKTVLDI